MKVCLLRGTSFLIIREYGSKYKKLSCKNRDQNKMLVDGQVVQAKSQRDPAYKHFKHSLLADDLHNFKKMKADNYNLYAKKIIDYFKNKATREIGQVMQCGY